LPLPENAGCGDRLIACGARKNRSGRRVDKRSAATDRSVTAAKPIRRSDDAFSLGIGNGALVGLA